MNVARHSRPPASTARPDEPVVDVAARMRACRVECLPVLDEHGRLLGVVTAKDLALEVLGRQRDPLATQVGAVMLRHAPTIRDDAPLDEAFDRMREARTQRLLVVDGERMLLGVLWLHDVTSAIAEEVHAQHPRCTTHDLAADAEVESEDDPILRRRPADVERAARRLASSRAKDDPPSERHVCRGRWCSGGEGCERTRRRPGDATD